MADKDYAAICHLAGPGGGENFPFPHRQRPRRGPATLADCCRKANAAAEVVVCRNIAHALAQAATEPFVVVTGSILFCGRSDAGTWPGLVRIRARFERLRRQLTGAARRSGIRAVTFDVGGTLIKPWPSVGRVYAGSRRGMGCRWRRKLLDAIRQAWAAKKDFSYSLSDWSKLVQQTFAGLVPTPPERKSFAARSIVTSPPPRRGGFLKTWRRVCGSLKRRGLKLGVISNWDDRCALCCANCNWTLF
jgi:hypothetical protein